MLKKSKSPKKSQQEIEMCELIEKYMRLMKENKNTKVEDYVKDVKKLIEKYLPPEIAEERKKEREVK